MHLNKNLFLLLLTQIPGQVQRLFLLVCVVSLETCGVQPSVPRAGIPGAVLQVHLQAAGDRQLLRLSGDLGGFP